jgi:hypothetical protein
MNAKAKTLKLEEISDKFSPFVQSCLQTEPRFRFTGVGNAVFDDQQIFVVTKDVIYMPTDLPTTEHEIAHAVEMTDQKRWLLPDWGLRFGKDWNQKLTPSKMFASMSREIRVRAIQLHMVPGELNNKYSSMVNILNNQHAWGSWAKKYTPFGRFKNAQDVKDWVDDLREKTYNAWSLERIKHEWKIRLTHMQEYMETKAA